MLIFLTHHQPRAYSSRSVRKKNSKTSPDEPSGDFVVRGKGRKRIDYHFELLSFSSSFAYALIWTAKTVSIPSVLAVDLDVSLKDVDLAILGQFKS